MDRFDNKRRQWLKAIGASAALGVIGGDAFAAARKGALLGRVVVIGGGFAGATAAKYLRKWSDGRIEVVLIERRKAFVSCPTSNEVLAGYREFDTLQHSYDGLKKAWGIKVVHAQATAIDADKRRVKTDSAGEFAYDHLIVAPGIELQFDEIAGYDAKAQETVLHAWHAGPQTLALKKQLEALPDGGVYALTIPKAPYRCPPGPYERASLVASYFKAQKPKSKVVILDANDKVQSKEKLFRAVWEADYKDILEYRPNFNTVALDAAKKIVTSEVGDTFQADVLNVIPPQRAGEIARLAGVVNINGRWAGIDWITYESTAVKNVHVIGDAVMAAPAMPKSGHMANQHGKAVAAAIVESLSGRAPQPVLLANTCYSRVDARRAIHVDSVHRYDAEKKQPLAVAGAGGVSTEPTITEGLFAGGWADTIWQDTLG